MREFNADKEESLFEPLKITLEGKEYVIAKLRCGMLEKVTDLADQVRDKKGTEGRGKTFTVLRHQLAELLGGKAEDFIDCDIFKINAVIEYINAELRNQGLGAKKGKAEVSK